MPGKLTDLTAGKLLEKFGAGNHKPGSGSASALQGMVAAQMLRTVIDLTNDPKRGDTYSKVIPQLLQIKQEIESRIYPELERLFQDDSDHFDKVINLREQRNLETDLLKKRQLSFDAQEYLKISTEIPTTIATRCLEIGEIALIVFDKGFQSARGDSGVAINSAISGVSSCLSIIELNLISLPADTWAEKILKEIADIKSKLENLSKSSKERLLVLEKESAANRQYLKAIAEFRLGNLGDSIRSNADIEIIVKRLQNALWTHRNQIWKNEKIDDPLLLLETNTVLKKVMNYVFIQPESLGKYRLDGGLFEIAGLIDKSKKIVQVSKNFSPETQNFTAAHELGHAILHRQTVLHRDKPLDGSNTRVRNKQEMEADKFAAYFLMPANLVEELFIEIFETRKFVINADTVFALNAGSVSAFRKKCKNLRGLARELASADYYKGKSQFPMASHFNVSIETMAIRLEEIGLLEF